MGSSNRFDTSSRPQANSEEDVACSHDSLRTMTEMAQSLSKKACGGVAMVAPLPTGGRCCYCLGVGPQGHMGVAIGRPWSVSSLFFLYFP